MCCSSHTRCTACCAVLESRYLNRGASRTAMTAGTLGPDGEHRVNPLQRRGFLLSPATRRPIQRTRPGWRASVFAVRRSVPLRVVALDEATKRIYRRTDSATLVGLLPELRRLNKGAQKERERLDRTTAANVDGHESDL